MRAPEDPAERTQMLAKLLTEGLGASVVYVTLQKTAVEVAQALVAAGLDARPYHAGLQPFQREVCFVSRGGCGHVEYIAGGVFCIHLRH